MRILALSDLHLDYIRLRNGLKIGEEREIIEILLKKVLRENIDIFILSGDISAKIWEIELFFELFKGFSGVKIFVPGNHDLWKEKDISSSDKYYKLLPDLCKTYDFYYLPFSPLYINDFVFVGTVGWYDYSFGDGYYDKLVFEKGEYKGLKWREVYWKLIDFVKDGRRLKNEEICDLMISELEKNMALLDRNKNIVVITHFLPFEDLLSMRNFFSAYLGSKKIGEVIFKYGADMVICGHEHRNGIYEVKNIKIFKPTFGYLDNYKVFQERIEKTSIVIETSDYNRFCVI